MAVVVPSTRVCFASASAASNAYSAAKLTGSDSPPTLTPKRANTVVASSANTTAQRIARTLAGVCTFAGATAGASNECAEASLMIASLASSHGDRSPRHLPLQHPQRVRDGHACSAPAHRRRGLLDRSRTTIPGPRYSVRAGVRARRAEAHSKVLGHLRSGLTRHRGPPRDLPRTRPLDWR